MKKLFSEKVVSQTSDTIVISRTIFEDHKALMPDGTLFDVLIEISGNDVRGIGSILPQYAVTERRIYWGQAREEMLHYWAEHEQDAPENISYQMYRIGILPKYWGIESGGWPQYKGVAWQNDAGNYYIQSHAIEKWRQVHPAALAPGT